MLVNNYARVHFNTKVYSNRDIKKIVEEMRISGLLKNLENNKYNLTYNMNSMIWNNSFTFQWQMNVDYKILNVCFDCELKETVWLFASEITSCLSCCTVLCKRLKLRCWTNKVRIWKILMEWSSEITEWLQCMFNWYLNT